MRSILFVLTVLLGVSIAITAGAVQIDSLYREASYSGGLDQPGMMGDGQTSVATGLFDESFGEVITDPGVAEAGANVSQLSAVDLGGGALVVDVTSWVDNYADDYATTLLSGAIADAIAWSQLYLVFTTTENMWLSVDVAVSSSLGVFYDGPGAGVVETSHAGSFLLCLVGGGCLADVLVDDVTDNGMAVSSVVQDVVLLPPGQYGLELLVVSQTISRDVGSAAGGASFSGTIRVDPLPEPGGPAGLAAGITLLVGLARSRARLGVRALRRPHS